VILRGLGRRLIVFTLQGLDAVTSCKARRRHKLPRFRDARRAGFAVALNAAVFGAVELRAQGDTGFDLDTHNPRRIVDLGYRLILRLGAFGPISSAPT